MCYATSEMRAPTHARVSQFASALNNVKRYMNNWITYSEVKRDCNTKYKQSDIKNDRLGCV